MLLIHLLFLFLIAFRCEEILDDSYYSVGHFPLKSDVNDLSNYGNHGKSENIEYEKEFPYTDFTKNHNSILKIP